MKKKTEFINFYLKFVSGFLLFIGFIVFILEFINTLSLVKDLKTGAETVNSQMEAMYPLIIGATVLFSGIIISAILIALSKLIENTEKNNKLLNDIYNKKTKSR